MIAVVGQVSSSGVIWSRVPTAVQDGIVVVLYNDVFVRESVEEK